jgi:hypothetical protein
VVHDGQRPVLVHVLQGIVEKNHDGAATLPPRDVSPRRQKIAIFFI